MVATPVPSTTGAVGIKSTGAGLPPGPPRKILTAASVPGTVLVPGTVTNALLSTDAPRRHMRAAAWSGKGSSSTDGAFAVYSWAPVAGNSWTVTMSLASAVAPAGLCGLWVRQIAGYGNIRVTTAGLIQIVNNTTVIGTTTAVALAFNGTHQTLRVAFSETSAAVSVNGGTTETLTFAAQSWTNGTGGHYIGATTTTSVQRWPGSIYNIEIRDLTTPANSATLLLDEPMSSSTYANSYSGTTAAATAAKQPGAAAPWTCAVVSTDGRGMPWQMGSGGAVVYSAYHASDVTGVVADTNLTFSGETSDPTGSLGSGVFTAPCAGTCVATLTMAISETGGVADNVTLGFSTDGSTTAAGYVEIGLAANANRVPVSVTSQALTLAAGGQLRGRFGGRTGGTFTFHTNYSIVYVFTPTPVAS